MRQGRVFLRSGILLLAVLMTLTGCESLRRKFTRRTRRNAKQEEMIIVPRDYSEHPFPNDVLYQQYFTYWKAWNQEWIGSLNDRNSIKKILSCGEQTLANIEKMGSYLQEEKKKELDVYIEKTRALTEEIGTHKNLLPSQYTGFRYRAERLLKAVHRAFSMRHVEDALL